MLAHTKKHHTEAVAIKFIGPVTNRRKALASLKALGFMSLEEESYVTMNELFPDVTDDKRPGVILAGARGKESMTQKQLAEKCGIPQSHISEMERGKRPIGPKTAKILGAALNIGYKVFL
jgi:ribosome-binding protein aMBF1 (putative translation factor)